MSAIPHQLNRYSSVSLYRQLKRILSAQIEEGVYEEDEQLPSENELAEKYKVSRHVVRQALKGLVNEGRIVAHQGAGYFVSRKRIRKVLPKLGVGSHTKSLAALGRPTETLVTNKQVVTPPDFIAERLAGEERQAVVLERLSFLDGEPVSLLVAYYPLRYQSVFFEQELDNKSVYATLQRCCGVTPARAETVISVAFADQHQSELLQVNEGAVLLNLSSFTWSDAGELFEYSSGYYRGDRFELIMEQRAQPTVVSAGDQEE